MLKGTVSKLDGKNWIFNKIELDQDDSNFADISNRYNVINNQIYCFDGNKRCFFDKKIKHIAKATIITVKAVKRFLFIYEYNL